MTSKKRWSEEFFELYDFQFGIDFTKAVRLILDFIQRKVEGPDPEIKYIGFGKKCGRCLSDMRQLNKNGICESCFSTINPGMRWQ